MYICKDWRKKNKIALPKIHFSIFSEKVYSVPRKSGLFWVYDLANISELSYKKIPKMPKNRKNFL